MIKRQALEVEATKALRAAPVTVLLGPRQCGKTTLAHQIAADRRSHFFDLEDPPDAARLETPMLSLESLRGLVIIDEVQRTPGVFEVIRVLADRPRTPARFLLLGSASPHLIKGVSESLAGRARLIDMSGFDIAEVGSDRYGELWLRGGFPRSFLARSGRQSLVWRNDYIRTFLERDVPQLGITVPAATLRRFWTMVAHFHGQIWNAAEFARSIGSSEAAARRYLDVLTGAYVIRQLQPWFENISKRQVKSPKVFIRDSGILHALLGIETRHDLTGHPKLGASWEGFALEQVLAISGTRDAYFWATHGGAELDLVVFRGTRRIGFEFKVSDAPSVTKSMHIAVSDLELDELKVVYPGAKSYRLTPKIDVVAITDLEASLR